ncbi:MAG: 5'/3'-nucleotidase SurE [Thermoguttaceae bacterium]
MNILLTNDDGIYAPGLAAMEKALRQLGDVYVVSPTFEQSGVGHGITFQTPLQVKQVLVNGNHWGWSVDGTPADCVKIALSEILPVQPDIVISGINGGLNAGVNILYSGTVSAAVEARLYGINSFAVSVEYREDVDFDKTAEIALTVIEKILKRKKNKEIERKNNVNEKNTSDNKRTPCLYNINIPHAALSGVPRLKIAPMDPAPYWDSYEKRIDPFGRPYFWLIGKPVLRSPNCLCKNDECECGDELKQTDLHLLADGCVTVTPLRFDMTNATVLDEIREIESELDITANSRKQIESSAPALKSVKIQ